MGYIEQQGGSIMKNQRIALCLLTGVLALPIASVLVPGSVIADSTDVAEIDAQGDIAIDAEHFPDEIFREIVKDYDKDGNGVLSQGERKSVSEINCFEKEELRSIKGVEYFPGLKTLVCSRSKVSELDISKNTELTMLWCEDNRIKNLDLSKNTKLCELYCAGNEIEKLDVSMLPDLWTLDCSFNLLTELDLSKNTGLERLNCTLNSFKRLDLSMLHDLTYLSCAHCGIRTLDLSNHPLLEELNVSGLKITDLDTHPCPNLRVLMACELPVPLLDLSGNPKLEELDVSRSGIRELDLSYTPLLKSLSCEEVNIPRLNLDPVNLETLSCSSSKLTSLDLSGQTNLVTLWAFYNKLTELDLTHNTQLEFCNINYNNLSELDISKCPNLSTLDIRFCLFKELPAGITNRMEVWFEPQRYVGKVEGLVLESSGQLPVNLSWKDVKEAEAFQIFRSDAENGDYELLGEATDLKYADTTAAGNQVYYYKVRGYRTMQEYSGKFAGEYSEIVKVDTTGWTADPGKPGDSGFAGFIERLYTMALDRDSDPEGKAYWIRQVVEEGKTGAECARFFLLGSDEFLGRNLTTEKFVEILYDTFFDRVPDAEGKKGWIEAIQSGRKTKADVVNDFIESTEWCDVCASYGVKSGAQWHKATKPSENAKNFATRLYTCCLKRDAEAGGLQYWALALTNLEKTGASAAQFFFEGEEFVGLKTSDKEYITRLYTTFMDREPSEKEVGYWINELTSGRNTRQSILAFFAQSPEFTKICKQYGIERGQL